MRTNKENKRNKGVFKKHKDSFEKNDFATIYNQDLEYISRCILDYPDIETGGDFFGFWNNLGLPVVLYVTGPGEKCYRSSSFFRQDLDFLVGVGNFVYDNFGLQHIGSWHSHHKLSLAVPSSHDCNTMVNVINNNSIEKFFMILGNITQDEKTIINGFLFDKENQTNYGKTRWHVLQSKNIISQSIEHKLKAPFKYIPKTKKSKLTGLKQITTKSNLVFSLEFEPKSWLTTAKGKHELKKVYEWFSEKFEETKMFFTESKDVELRAETTCLIFKYDFPNSHPKLRIEETYLAYEDGKFEYQNETDIIAFISSKLNTLKTEDKQNP